MKLLFCMECTAPLQQLNKTDYKCRKGHSYWNNPKVAASVMIIKGKQVLAAKRGIEPAKGKYDLPGGFLEYGESPREAAKREILEETGLTLGELELMDVFTNEYVPNISVSDVVFLARHWNGQFTPRDDVAALEWRPIGFFNTTEFAWSYPGLATKLEKLL